MVFLDANVLLEIILERSKQQVAKSILSEYYSTDLDISALTGHLVIYFGQKRVELTVLRQFLKDYTILPLQESDFEWAFTNTRNNDFEDALQLAVAIRNGCTDFITFDKSLAAAYKDLTSISIKLLS